MPSKLSGGVDFQIDATRLETQAKLVVAALKGINATLDDVGKVTQKLDKDGQALEVRFAGLTKEGNKFVVTLDNAKKLFPKVNVEAEKFTKILTEQEIAFGKLATATKFRLQIFKAHEERLRAQTLALKENIIARNEVTLRVRALNTALRERTFQEHEKRIRAQTQALRENIIARNAVAQSIRNGQIAQNTALRQSIGADVEKERIETFRRLRENIQERLTPAFKKVGDVGRKAGKDILITWKSVGRLFVVQALHASIALLRRLFSEAARDAFEFSKKIAEIRTITDESTDSTQEWARALTNVSRTLPFKQIELAEAAYQALSNQVIDTVRDLGFIREAGQLALVGVSDTVTAVNALTSVINSFGFSMLRTTDISATLFKTVQLGRTRLEDLEQNLGRVSLLSSQLGVSFKEQEAALATLTIQGVKDNVAKTFLVNILNKLIRPTEKMKNLFKEWSVTSGESAVATFGFSGVLNKLFEEAERSGDALEFLGEAAGRIRATIGFIGLRTAIFGENLAKFNDSADDFQDKVEEISQTTFVKLKQELTNVNTLLIQVGTALNSIGLSIARSFGGLDNAVKALGISVAILATVFVTSRLAAIIGGIAVSVINLTVAVNALSVANAVLLKSGIGVFISLAAIVATAFLAMQAHSAVWALRVQEDVDKVHDDFTKLHEQLNEESKKALLAWVKNIDKSAKRVAVSLAIVESEIQGIINALEVDLESAFSKLQNTVDDFSEAVVDSLKSRIDTIKDGIKDINKDLTELENKIESNLKKFEKIKSIIKERQVEDANIGKTDQELAAGLEELGTISGLEKAQKINEKIARDRKRSDEERIKASIEVLRLQVAITDAHIAELKALGLTIDAQQQGIVELENEKAIEKAELAIREAILKTFEKAQEKFKEFDIENVQKESAIRVGKPISVDVDDKIFNLEEITQETLDRFDKVTDTLLDSAKAAGVNTVELERDIQDRRFLIIKDFKNKEAQLEEKELTRSLSSDITQINKRQKNAEDEIVQAKQNILANETAIIDSLERIRSKAKEVIPKNVFGQSVPFQELTPKEAKQFLAFRKLNKLLKETVSNTEAIARERSKNKPDEDEIIKQLGERADLLEKIAGLASGIPGLRGELGPDGLLPTDFGEGLSGSDVFKTLTTSTNNLKESLDQFARAENTLRGVELANAEIERKLEAEGLDRERLEAEKSNTTSIIGLTRQIRFNITALGDLRRELIFRDDSLPPLLRAQGGMTYGPGGIDNVPAMLTAGEFVMNARATRANLPVLQAMNNPRGFARGGNVQNVSFGDINVTGGSTNQATVREIARGIKREISRGTLTL